MYVFSFVQSCLSAWLDYALVILVKAARRDNAVHFKNKWTSVEEQKPPASLMENNRKFGCLVNDVCRITNRGGFKVQHYGDPNMQCAYFEHYSQQEELTNLFVFNVFEDIIHAAINLLGGFHDTNLAPF